MTCRSSKVCAVGSARARTRPRRCTCASGVSGRSRSSTTTTRSGRPSAGSRSRPVRCRSGATPTCCRPPPRAPSTSAPGSPRWCGPTGWPPSSAWASCGSKTTPSTRPARSRTGSSRSRSPRPGSSGFKVAACASTGNLANSVAAHAAQAGMESVVFIPADLEPAKVVTTAVFGGRLIAVDGNYDDVNRLCAELAGEYPVVGVRQRQRAHLLRRGLEDAGLRGGRAARVAGPGPRRGAGGVRQPADQGGQGLPGAVHGRPARRGAARPHLRRPGGRLLAGGRRRSPPGATWCGR